MEENFSMEWKKIASMEYGKIVFHSIPYHALFLVKELNKGVGVGGILPTRRKSIGQQARVKYGAY